MLQKEYLCESCKRSFTADADASGLRCPYCAQEVASPATPDAELFGLLRSLFERGDYAAVLHNSYEGIEDADECCGLLRAAAALFLRRESYIAAARELDGARTLRGSLGRLLLGKDEFGENELHARFFDDSQKDCRRLAELAGRCASAEGRELSALLAQRACEALLKRKTDAEWGSLAMPLIAAEHHCVPLLPLVPPSELKTLCAEYAAAYKRYERLPNQKKTLAAMEDELKRRPNA